LSNTVTGSSYADYSIDHSKVLVSRGNLTGATNAQATSANGVVTLTRDDNSGSSTATQTDKALIVVFKPDKSRVCI